MTRGTRQRIQSLAHLDVIEVEAVILGQLTGLRSAPAQVDIALAEEERRQLHGSFSDPAMWDSLHEFLGYGPRAPLVAFTVIASQATDGAIRGIVDDLAIEPALPEEVAARIEELAALRTAGSNWVSPLPAVTRWIVKRISCWPASTTAWCGRTWSSMTAPPACA